MTELEKMQIALFMVIRNSRVLPVGIAKEKSMQEINKMSYETMQECIKMINFDIAVKYYQEGKQLCEANENDKYIQKHKRCGNCVFYERIFDGYQYYNICIMQNEEKEFNDGEFCKDYKES